MNALLECEDLNAKKNDNSQCVHNLPFLFYAITYSIAQETRNLWYSILKMVSTALKMWKLHVCIL